jgi:hypothetical protein
MAAATRTAARISDAPGERSMTRHEKVAPSAAGAHSPAPGPRASTVNIALDRGTTSLVQDRLDLNGAQRSHLAVSIPTLPGGGRAIADISRGSKSP